MHDYGNINLKGYKGVFKTQTFYKKDASVKERTFVFESGKGLLPEGNIRLIYGHFEIDGFKGTANNYDFEAVIAPDGTKIKAPVTAFTGIAGPLPSCLNAPLNVEDPKKKPETEEVETPEKKLVPRTVRRKR